MTTFNASHNEAFESLGAMAPGQHWSSFDVPRAEAQRGNASRFVMTIWNFHSRFDERGRRIATKPGIHQDPHDGSYWYGVARPLPGEKRKTWVAHWNGLQFALEKGVPIIGMLKDVHTSRCSLEHVFDCGPAYDQFDGSVRWLRLRPRTVVGCEVGIIDIQSLTGVKLAPATAEEFESDFRDAVASSLEALPKLSDLERDHRLASARPLPTKTQVLATVFNRNPDVVATVLLRATGTCEGCKQPAPFMRRSDGSPYLEVHHRKPLAQGGDDTVANAIALCPNCHRKAHYA